MSEKNYLNEDSLTIQSDYSSDSLSDQSEEEDEKIEEGDCEFIDLGEITQNNNNNNDDNSSDYCIEITHDELTKNTEAKASLQNLNCKVKILSAKESKEYCENKKKKETEEKFLKEAKRNRFKTIPSNRKFNTVTGKFELIDQDFDVAINKEFNDNLFSFPNENIIFHENERDIPKVATSKNISEKAKTLGFKLDLPNNTQSEKKKRETENLKLKKDKKIPLKPINQKRRDSYSLPSKTPSPHSQKTNTNNTNTNTNTNVKENGNLKNVQPKKNIINKKNEFNEWALDIKRKKEGIIKQIYRDNHKEKYNIKILYKESIRIKKHMNDKNYFFKYIPDENRQEFFRTGIFLFKNLVSSLLETCIKNNNVISLKRKDLWDKAELKAALKKVKRESQNHDNYRGKEKNIGIKRQREFERERPQIEYNL